MKLLIMMFIGSFSQAAVSCPIPLTYRGENFCIEMQWQKTELYKNGQYSSTTNESPYLNPANSKPPQWNYSRLQLKVWKAEDTQQSALEVSGLRFLPFMTMDNGHHHSWNHAFELDTATNIYTLWQMPFQDMAGCWQIQWMDSQKPKESYPLMILTKFTNLDTTANNSIEQKCKTSAPPNPHHH